MAFGGISVSDLKHTGWNLGVVAVVTTASMLTAWGVQKLTEQAFRHLKPTAMDTTRIPTGQWMGEIAGTAIGIAANYYIPSRFALINDPSLSKMFKLGSVLGITGIALDRFTPYNCAIFAVLGAGTAIAGRWSSYGLTVFGALGACLVTRVISRHEA